MILNFELDGSDHYLRLTLAFVFRMRGMTKR